MNQQYSARRVPPGWWLVFFACACLPMPAAAAAGDAAYGTFSGVIEGKQVSITFRDIYAFHAVSSRKVPRVVVYLTDSPMDKNAMTATLRKARKTSAITTFGTFLDGKAKANLHIEDGKITYVYLYSPPGQNLNVAGTGIAELGKSEVKVSATRLEGRFTTDGAVKPGAAGKIDLRLTTDLVDVGPGAPIED